MGSRSESISLILKVTKNRSWTVKNKCKYSHTFYLSICTDYSMALISALPSQFPDFHVRSPSWEWGHPDSGHCYLLSSINGLLQWVDALLLLHHGFHGQQLVRMLRKTHRSQLGTGISWAPRKPGSASLASGGLPEEGMWGAGFSQGPGQGIGLNRPSLKEPVELEV